MLGAKSSPWPTYLLPIQNPMKNLKLFWKIGSSIVVPSIFVISKLWMDYLTRVKIHNHEVFIDAIKAHERDNEPLLSFSNHTSCLDDPAMFGAIFPWKWSFNWQRHRWISGAHDICFSRSYHSLFFTLGKVYPVVRGEGIYQPAMDFATQLLESGQFIHIFPQGKVVEEPEVKYDNLDVSHPRVLTLVEEKDRQKSYELKWGTARLILDAIGSNPKLTIHMLPFYHIGMDDVLPNTKPYIPKIGKRVTVLVRAEGPIKFNREFIMERFSDGTYSSRERRIAIMEYIANELKILKSECYKLHQSNKKMR